MLQKMPVAYRKKDGFKGQKAIVLPGKIIQSCDEASLIQNLFITDIGFYPKAKFHYRKRSVGIASHILIYCIDGKGWVKLGDQEYEVNSGQYVVLPAGTVHQYGSDEANPWSIYWLHFKGSSASDYVSQLTKNGERFVASVNFSEERIRLFDSIYTTLESGYSPDNLGYINMCLWYFLSTFCYDEVFQVPSGETEKDAIDLSIEFMQQNIEQPLSLRSHFPCGKWRRKPTFLRRIMPPYLKRKLAIRHWNTSIT
ncbi:MAG: cupin domain-containing protein [Chitinophagaceae bacterium]|nr:MAG: cupin domain-containing protein [Chitinophagaceae bacterium]